MYVCEYVCDLFNKGEYVAVSLYLLNDAVVVLIETHQIAIIGSCVSPHILVPAKASTQASGCNNPRLDLSSAVIIGKNQFAIIANCVFPHNLVAAQAPTQSVAATAPPRLLDLSSCGFHSKKTNSQ